MMVSSMLLLLEYKDNVVDKNIVYGCADDPNMPNLDEIFYSDHDEEVGIEADINNFDAFILVSPIPTTSVHKDHLVEQIIRDFNSVPQTRRMKKMEEHSLFSSVQLRTNHKVFQNCLFTCFLSQEEPKKIVQALKDPSWIEAIQEELLQFKLQEVWTLVKLPNEKRAIGTKWVFKNKKDERAIRLFLAYASFKDFVVYQMDVKSDFPYSKIKEKGYVCQLPGFEDPDFPDRVYKVEKALYELHQAPRAWYETLSTYLLDNRFQRGKIDNTLFIKRDKSDILFIQVYVDDIIFGSTRKKMYTEFEKMMHKKFQMCSIGELTIFLGLQVKQKEDWIFISQDKYVNEILNKFGFSDVKTARTHMETQKALLKDVDGEDVDAHLYRSMIGSLMYLTFSRPDIMFAAYAGVRFQVNPKATHLYIVKRIFRYIKGQPKFGLWYPKDSPFDLVEYTDSDYAGASLDILECLTSKVFIEGRFIGLICSGLYTNDDWNGREELQWMEFKLVLLTLIGSKTIAWNEFSSTMASAITCLATNQKFNFFKYIFDNMVKNLEGGVKFLMYPRKDPHHTPTLIQPSTSQPKKKHPRKSKKKNIKVPEPSDSTNDVADENVPTHSNDPLLSGKDRQQLNELMDLCTNLQKKVLDLEEAKTAQVKEIASLKKRVKKLEKKKKSRTLRIKRLRKGGSARRVESSDDAMTLIDETQGRNDEDLMFDTIVLDDQEVEVEKVVCTAEVTTASVTTTIVDELTLAKTLIEIKAAKPNDVTTDATTTTTDVTRPKARGVIVQVPKIRAREKRNKPPTQAQQRKLYCNYLKNMEGYTLKQLKGFKFEVIKDMFDKALKRVNTFVDYKIELTKESSKKAKVEKESSSKRARVELESDNLKKY
ncbi:putative ribonuclease H-like domain-containing protein [Tanacetum coccineum]